MITFTRRSDSGPDDEIILQMSVADFERLTGILAFAFQSSPEHEKLWDAMKIVNELNRTNPAWTPYEIPEK